jgi:glutamine amidotransferase
MTMKTVMIDAGVGNLGNLERALRSLGAEVEVTTSPEVVAGARCLLLPGVGAFRPPREALRGALEEALGVALEQGAFLLGICVGYQLLFEDSEEFGHTDGLGLLEGQVVELPPSVQRPHMGWNQLRGLSRHPLVEGVENGAHAYFVHSFAPTSVPESTLVASCMHGVEFAAIAAKDRVLGAQFHPEKSGDMGLRILANYLELAGGTSTRA